MAPLLRCALLYVEKFSDDIIAARREAAGLAWHIRNRPFGHVAGAIQYQHAQITMFEGYAGTSASGFRQEVEAEREAANLAELFHLVVGAPNWGTP
jgi:hypothetical protein